MEALLRELTEEPGGIAGYHDTEVRGDAITLGSAADQSIQLIGRSIAPQHAIIRGSGAQLTLTCRRGRRVDLNGKPTSGARLAIGDVIELAGHRLTIVEPPGGFDLAVELQPNAAIDAGEFESAFRTDLLQTWLGKRPTAWIAVSLVVLLGLVLPLVTYVMHRSDRQMPAWLPGDALWNSGPLHEAHAQAAGDRCDTCHEQLFQRVRDAACLQCHKATHDHVQTERLAMTGLGATQRCATCHREHNVPQSFLVNSSDAMCIDCHADSTHDFGKLAVAPVSGFSAERHPQFRAQLLRPIATQAGAVTAFEWVTEIQALDAAKEQSNLKFSHVQHMDPDRVLSLHDSEPLACADCHRLEPDGEHFEPITMENRCASCHELTFDPGAPDRQLPHGKPREVVLTLQDYFTRKFSAPDAGRVTRERRRLPGHDDEELTCTGAPFDCAMRAARTEIETQFTRRGCVGCHVVIDTASESVFDRWQVYPIRLARDYFPAGRFDHRSHRIQGKLTGDAACLSCHAAKQSADSSDLLLPAMAKCEECHGDRPALERITVQCVSCHAYHPSASTEQFTQSAQSPQR